MGSSAFSSSIPCSQSSKEPDQAYLLNLHEDFKARSMNRRFSARTREIFELLAAKTKQALDKGATDYDRVEAATEYKEMQTITRYVDKSQAQVKKLEKSEHMARFGDYAMVTCKALKEAPDKNWSFRKLWWVDVNRQLDEEERRLHTWETSSTAGEPRPDTKLRDELIRDMYVMGEDDIEQVFWEIRFYRDQKETMHSGVLDMRLAGKYDQVLASVEADLKDLEDILPHHEKGHLKRYSRALCRFRNRWFEVKDEGKNGQQVWGMNLAAKKHLRELEESSDTKEKIADIDKLRRNMNEVKSLVDVVKTTVEEGFERTDRNAEQRFQALTGYMVANLEYHAASSTKLNTSQKRLLSVHGVYSPGTNKMREAENGMREAERDSAFTNLGAMCNDDDDENKENKESSI